MKTPKQKTERYPGTVLVSARVRKETADALRFRADEERRSLPAQIGLILDEHVKDNETDISYY